MRRKRAIIPLFLVILFSLSVFFLIPLSSKYTVVKGPVSKEEAAEISKDSRLVQEGLTIAWKSTVVTDYYNSSMVERMRNGPSGVRFERVPEGHCIWQVAWLFFYQNKPGFFNVIVVVDADVGTLLYEERGADFL